MTRNNQGIKGVWTALATPFSQDLSIAWDDFEKLLTRQANAGVDGVVISGTTGEAPTLSVQEKLSLIRKARAFLPDSIRVMAGTGGNNTDQSIELSRLAEDAGADSLLIVTPPYNKPTLSGLKAHFSAIADKVGIPLCLYHVPGRTAQLLKPQEIAAICANPKIQAVKEASGDVALFSRAKMASQVNFLSGDDPTYLASLSVGGVGVISVVSNVFPEALVALTKAFESGDPGRACTIHEALLECIDILFCETNPCPLKAALAIENLCGNYLRLPLAPVSADNYKNIKAVLTETHNRLRDIGVGDA